MDTVRVAARVEQLPHDFLFSVHLENAHFGGVFLMITAYDRVAVVEALAAARIVEPAGNVRVVHAPNDLPFRVELHRLVAVREVDNRIAVGQPDRGERPVLGKRKYSHRKQRQCKDEMME